MAQTHLERLRELRQWQAESDRELARRRPVPSERGARGDPGRQEQARAPMMRCQDCHYFAPWPPNDHGDCMAKKPPSWVTQATTRWPCPLFLSAPLGIAVQVLADRWQYSEQELAAALRCAANDPAGWWRVIDADLEARLWPAPSGRSEKESAYDRAEPIGSRRLNRIGEGAGLRDSSVRRGSAAEWLAELAVKKPKKPEPSHRREGRFGRLRSPEAPSVRSQAQPHERLPTGGSRRA